MTPPPRRVTTPIATGDGDPIHGLTHRLARALNVVDERGTRGTRLIDDAQRFCKRIHKFIAMGLVGPDASSRSLEICCYALQLPLRSARPAAPGKPARTSLRERAEAAAEMLVSLAGDLTPGIEEAVVILGQVHQRRPASDLARLLADTLNLEDFGVLGLVNHAMTLATQGAGVAHFAEGLEKREQYGYWEARLNDGFHFDQIRQIAKKRLEHARRVATLLTTELREDGAL